MSVDRNRGVAIVEDVLSPQDGMYMAQPSALRREQQADITKLDTAIKVNLKGFGFGK